MAEAERNGTALEREYLPDGGKVRLLSLQDLDGRTATAKRVAERQAAFWSDLGGRDLLSEGQLQLARRAAVLGAILEHAEASWAAGRTFDLDKYLAATNTFRRIVDTMRQHRRSRPPNLLELMGEPDG